MRKIMSLAAAFSSLGSVAFAGGMALPVVEMAPEVIEEAASSSAGGLIIPLILLALIAAVMSSKAVPEPCLVVCS